MTRVHNGWLALTAACFFAVASAACDNTAQGVKQDAAAARENAREASADTKAATADAKDKADAATADARAEARDEKNDAKRATGTAAGAVDAASETLDVKAALMADNTIDASDINVDTLKETKTVVLKGSVPTAAQKTAAGRVATREAEGYKIDNQLMVKPRK